VLAAACAAGPPSTVTVTVDTVRPPAGTVSTVTIPATVSGFRARVARLYLPPAYPGSADAPLPVLLMVAGVPGSTEDWFTNARVRQDLDGFAAAHGGRAPIVVAADDTGVDDEDLLCMDSSLGNVDSYLSQDVPAWISQHLHADPDTSTWAVGGLSYGGTCALQLAVRHPATFPTFLDFSGEQRPTHDTVQAAVTEVFDGDAGAYSRQDPLRILATRRFPGSAGMLVVGGDDEPYTSEQRVVTGACRDAGIQITASELPGGHEWPLWSTAFTRSMPWLVRRMGLAGAR
jgi:S-formylglutathione hydrolase FrmB